MFIKPEANYRTRLKPWRAVIFVRRNKRSPYFLISPKNVHCTFCFEVGTNFLYFGKHTPANMIHGILKEHKVHGGHQVVVPGERLIQQLLDLRPIFDREVLRVADAFSEVAVDERFLKHYVLVVFLSVWWFIANRDFSSQSISTQPKIYIVSCFSLYKFLLLKKGTRLFWQYDQ